MPFPAPSLNSSYFRPLRCDALGTAGTDEMGTRHLTAGRAGFAFSLPLASPCQRWQVSGFKGHSLQPLNRGSSKITQCVRGESVECNSKLIGGFVSSAQVIQKYRLLPQSLSHCWYYDSWFLNDEVVSKKAVMWNIVTSEKVLRNPFITSYL